MNTWQVLVDYYLHERDFWVGVGATLAVLLFLELTLPPIIKLSHIIRQFFAPAKKPGKAPETIGPSPFLQLWGCVQAIFALIGVGVAIILVVRWWVFG